MQSLWMYSFETWSQSGKIRKHHPCVLVWTANPHTLRIDEAIYPTLDLLTLWRLITTTTTTMADYMLVFVLQKILSLVTRTTYYTPLPLPWAKKDYGQLTWHFHLLLVVLVFSFFCLYTVRKLYVHAPSLLLRFWWISSATYRPDIWTTASWVVYNGSVSMQIFLKQCQGRWGKKRLFLYVWTWPQLNHSLVNYMQKKKKQTHLNRWVFFILTR